MYCARVYRSIRVDGGSINSLSTQLSITKPHVPPTAATTTTPKRLRPPRSGRTTLTSRPELKRAAPCFMGPPFNRTEFSNPTSDIQCNVERCPYIFRCPVVPSVCPLISAPSVRRSASVVRSRCGTGLRGHTPPSASADGFCRSGAAPATPEWALTVVKATGESPVGFEP